MKADFVIVVILFIVILFISLGFSSYTVVPYSDTITNSYGSVEGYRGMGLGYSNASDLTPSKDDGVLKFSLNSDANGEPKKVAGFPGYGLFVNPVAAEVPIDIYSNAKGDLKSGLSYGYYNSMGPLQLDANMVNQLKTRGQNAAGAPSKIGGAQV